MTKRRFKRPADPAEIMARKLERARLQSQPDVRVVVAPDHVIIAANRQDVFDLFANRKAISQDHLVAVRRLEADMARAEGVDRQPASGRIDHAAKGALDHKLDAAARVQAVTRAMPIASAGLICDLLGPQFEGKIADWRHIVRLHTAECDKDVQSYILRAACGDLVRAFRFIDNEPRKKTA